MPASPEYIRMLFDREPWPHQISGVRDCIAAIESGEKSLALTSPTGGGKSVQMAALLRWAIDCGHKAALYTNRNMLLEQTIRVLQQHRIGFGVRGAQFPDYRDLSADVQLCSIQTELSQCITKEKRTLHKADLVLVDEAHLMKNGGAETIVRKHMDMGGKVIGVTATPLGISHLYNKLIVAGKVSELFQCGALVPAIMYAPDEMDLSKIKPTKTGEYSIGDIRKEVWTPAIIERVFDRWKHDNPDARHALAFAPGVQESIWFAEQYYKRGVRAAHIDGEEVWIDGKYYASSRSARDDVLSEWNANEIKILFNRFVMREGIDIPSCYHLILATPIGSLLSYIQTVGRVMRKSPLTPNHVIITDHAGMWWRHGSPNEDRNWEDLFHIPASQITRTRLERMRENKLEEPEPITCPNCGLVRRTGKACPPPPIGCGFSYHKKLRFVLQHDGTLKEMWGDILKPRKRIMKLDTQDAWNKMYYPSRNSKSPHASTFYQLEARFFLEHKYYPPRDLKNMPREEGDWARKVNSVPKAHLIGE